MSTTAMLTPIAAATPAVALPEQLTLHVASSVLEQLSLALSQQAGPDVVLHAHKLRVFDSSAVAVLLELRRRLQSQAKTLQVSAAPERLRQLATLYGVAELLAL